MYLYLKELLIQHGSIYYATTASGIRSQIINKFALLSEHTIDYPPRQTELVEQLLIDTQTELKELSISNHKSIMTT